MRVVFTQDVTNVAEAGEVKEVKRGYAKNFLFPRNLAVPATANELNRIEALKRTAAQRRQREEGERDTLGHRLEGVELILLQRAGPMGQLYGSVTNAAIAEELSKVVEQPVDRRAIEIAEPIRQTGEYEVTVHLGPERVFPLKVVVTTEELLQRRATAEEQAVAVAEPEVSEEELEEASDQVEALEMEEEEAASEDLLEGEAEETEETSAEEQEEEREQ